MCRPSHYDIEYVINPWMEGGVVNPKKAMVQWERLVECYKSIGVEVSIIDQRMGLPDMVFAADQGIVFSKSDVLLSNFRYKQRVGESTIYSKWFEEHGYKIHRLPPNMYFEGNGELQKWRDMLFIGTGFRTSYEATATVGQIMGKEVLPIELVDERFYHLDTCLFVLNDDVVFYYPKALSEKSKRDLKKLLPRLIEVSESEACNFATNSVVIGQNVVIQKGNKRVVGIIRGLGFNVSELDVSEFMKSGGGIHCLTGELYN